MEEEKKFKIYSVSLFLLIGLITILEIFNKQLFGELFLRISENTAWILGLTIGMVLPNIIKQIKSKTVDRVLVEQKVDDRFIIFLANAALLSFVVSFAKGIIMVFFKNYFEYFHIILLQWLVIVYLWFKFINGFKIHWKYVITTEIIVIAFTGIILFSIR